MEQRSPRLRWFVVWVLAVVWMGAVLGRLSYLQLFCYSEYLAKAQRQQRRIFEISPKRGSIYDRSGHELAVSIPMDSLFVDPNEITDAAMVARLLSHVLGEPGEEIEAKLREAHSVVRLARKMAPETAGRIEALNLRGVFCQKENRRVYPQRELAAHVLGYVDVDEHGLGGIEYSLDKQIRGRPGLVMAMADGRRRWYDRTEEMADPGASVVLTIDETIQYIAQKELQRGIEETHAKNGSVVVQDPNTGQLLAVAIWPSFDPNDAGNFPDEVRMDRAVSAAYEPGSTFKLVTLVGAIENGVASPGELIDCQMGSIRVANRVIHDWHPFGILSVRDVLAHSSDVGAIKIALELGAPRFYEAIRRFGIGQLTGIELPGENRGLLRPLREWSASSIGSIAIGQEVGVTPVQIISAVSAIANGGALYPPRVVREIRGGNSAPRPEGVPHQAMDGKTAATLRNMMEAVILEGTGRPAKLEGWTGAGKSGTAQKIDPATGRYSRSQYVASFVGFAPVNSPVVTILAVFDSPVGVHHGGDVGGPVFKRVAEQTLAYLDVPHDVPVPSGIGTGRFEQASRRSSDADAVKAQFKAAVAKAGISRRSAAPTVAFDETDAVEVPSLAGQTVRSVTEECLRVGLVPSLIGSGVALEQSPEAGARVVRGSRVTIRFGRASEFSTTPKRGDGE